MSTQLATVQQRADLALRSLGFDTSILAGGVAASSSRIYARDFLAYFGFAGSPAAALDAATLARWRSYLAKSTALSPNTINRQIAAVKRLIAEAAAQGYCTHETAAQFREVRGVKVAALKERQRATARTRITPEQMAAICNAPDPSTLAGKMHRALLATLAGTGLRISEAVSLTPAQIEFGTDEEGRSGWLVWVMGKNEIKPSKRAMSAEAHRLIAAWLGARAAAGVHSEYIFTGFTGRGSRGPRTTAIRPASAWEMVRRYAKRAGLEHIKPHDFRRFVGTELAKKDLRLAQKQLGHKRISTTADNYVLDDIRLGQTDDLY